MKGWNIDDKIDYLNFEFRWASTPIPLLHSHDFVHPHFGCSISLIIRTDVEAKALVEKYGSVWLSENLLKRLKSRKIN